MRERRPDLPEALSRAFDRASERDRAARYPIVADLDGALTPWAPPRSQPMSDRIERTDGVAAPVAGDPPPPSPTYAPPQHPADGAAADAPSPPSHLSPGPYSAPASMQAATAFAMRRIRAKTGASGLATAGRARSAGAPAQRGLKAAAVVLLAIAIVGGGVGLTVLVKDGAKRSPATAAPIAAPTAAAMTSASTARAVGADASTDAPVASASPTASARAAPAAAAATSDLGAVDAR